MKYVKKNCNEEWFQNESKRKVIDLIKEDKRTVWIKYPPGAD